VSEPHAGLGRARIRALELIENFLFLFDEIEEEVRHCDEWLTELRAQLAAGPTAMPLPTYIKQIEGREVA
jgi:hypothetical protein